MTTPPTSEPPGRTPHPSEGAGPAASLGQHAWPPVGDQLAAAFDLIPDGFATLDPNWRWVYLNAQAAEICGHEREEMLGQGLFESFPPAAEPSFRAALERAVREGSAGEVEGYYPPWDSWFEVRFRPHEGGVSLVLRDVTERRRRSALLEGLERTLEGIARRVPVEESLESLARVVDEVASGVICSILLMDEEGTHVRAGAGPGLDEAYNRAIDGAPIGPRAGSCGTAAFRREPVIVADIERDPLWEDYKDLALEFGLRACWSYPILDAEGVVLGTFALYREVPGEPRPFHTELVEKAKHVARIAIEAGRSEARLEDTVARLQEAVAAGRIGFWDWDLRTDQVAFSKEWKSQIGYEEEEISNEFDEWEGRLHPEDRERALATVREFLAGSEPRFQCEFRLRHKDGSYRHILAQAAALCDEQGTRIRMVGSHVDVTQHHELEAKYLQAQKLESVGRLAGGIAHDFNNLLTAILGYADLAGRGLTPEDPVLELLQELQRAGERAATLTRQLLAFSRRQPLELKVLDLNALAGDLTAMLGRLIGEDVQLALRADPELGRIKADAGQIEQVIVNLCVNARDAMPEGGQLRIETQNRTLSGKESSVLGAVEPGSYVALVVSDTGTGIPDEVLPHLFEPFYTTKERGKGTGLGLATIYGIVGGVGGHIALETKAGEGTSFTLLFPRVDTPSDSTSATCAADPPARPGKTILLVEDDELVRELNRKVLGLAGYSVIAASDGAEALRQLEETSPPPDLLLTDFVLPGMSGTALAEQLLSERPELAVLFCSGYGEVSVGDRRVSGNLVSKPYTPQVLLRAVREALEGQ